MKKSISFLLRLLLVGMCAYGFHLLLKDASWSDASAHVSSLSLASVLLAFAGVAASYVALIGYDYLGCRYARLSLTFSSIASTALLANAISNMIGFALFSGGAVRLRCYGALGATSSAVAKVSLFCTLTFLLGLMMAGALGLAFDPLFFAALLPLSVEALRLIGWSLLIFGGLLPVLVFFYPAFKVRGRFFRLPSWRLVLGQYIVGSVDILATGLVLFMLLPHTHQLSFFSFIPLFSAALWLGLVSNVPGGLGVFETVILTGLSSIYPSGQILGALLVYRFVYYVVPFILATTSLVIIEVKAFALKIKPSTATPLSFLSRASDYLLPLFLSALTAFAGIILLASGTTPIAEGRVDLIADFIPLGVIEGSHLMGSLIGFALLIVARGLYYRYDSAYVATIFLLALGSVSALIKGFDYEEALFLMVVLPMVALSRRMFYRPSKVSMMDVGWMWWSFVALTLCGVVWLLFFAYQNVDYDHYLWWQIALGTAGDASRSLRSTLVLCVFGVGLGLHQLFRPSKPVLEPTSAHDLARAASIVAQVPSTNACLALTGDKYFLFAAEGDAFVMFNMTPRSLIAMNDPVGNSERFPKLIWHMREIADRHRRGLAFYQVGTNHMPAYIDSGMQLVRLGEEALIDLQNLTFEGSRYRNLRYTLSKCEREGLSYGVIPKEQVSAHMDALRLVSDEWLKSKNVREKSFSLGKFDESYIQRFPVAVIREQGRIIAFANIWSMDSRDELSVDLMRHCSVVPNGTMDYLFTKLLMWGKDEGYRYFNIGMVPLSGFNTHRLAPLWTKLGSFIFNHGERFYNFQGLHAFKSKYHPLWRPRYMAYTGKSSLFILLDVAILIAGGFRGLFRK